MNYLCINKNLSISIFELGYWVKKKLSQFDLIKNYNELTNLKKKKNLGELTDIPPPPNPTAD